MKSIMIAVFFLFMSNVIFSQNKKIPNKTKTEFLKQFPSATNLKWKVISDNVYQVEYQDKGIIQVAVIDDEGKILFFKNILSFDNLNKDIKNTILKEKKSYEIYRIYENSSAARPSQYEVILKNKNDDINKEIIIDEKGKIISERIVN